MDHQSPSLSHPQSRGAHPFDAPLLPSPSPSPSAPRTAGVAVQPDAKAHIASPPSSSTRLGHHGDTPPPSTHSHSNATPGLLNAQQLLPYNLQMRAVTDHSPASLSDPAAANAFPDAFRFHIRNPSAAGLTLQTADLSQPTATTTLAAGHNGTDISKLEGSVENLLRHSATAPISINDNHLRSTLSAGSMTGSLSPGSALSSPALNALADITPLPSPLAMTDSPASLWGKSHTSVRPRSRGASGSSRDDSLFTFNNNGTLSPSPSLKKKNYQRLKTDAALQSQQTNKINRARNSSLSEEFKPESTPNFRSHQRSLTQIPTHHGPSPFLHREAYLAAHRGLVSAASGPAGIPTPPASNRSVTESEEEEISEEDKTKYLIVRQGPQGNKKLWRPVRQLGQGTFSKVWLATSEKVPAKDPLDEATLDPHQLVAIKVVEHGPAGGADEERVMLSLKREVDMLRSISHPSLVHLKAFDHGDKQALLVLTYCPGGDLFDVASSSNNLLRVDLVQRIFAELVAATRYLHNQLIVHRDIKLENVLLNIPTATVPLLKNPPSHPYPIATLTDLGLSRRIPAPPESPLLNTRCGSEDYAAPEILLGQPYDGRQTDAWALGVVLYALMEGRLPFDPPPGKAGARSRATHRIARCDWDWLRFGDDDGEWDPEKGKDWEGARACVEGLLKKVSRGRKSLEDIEKLDWVRQGIQVDGGIKSRIEDESSTPDMNAR